MNKYAKDLTERVVGTFLMVLIPLVSADGINLITGLDWGKSLIVAGGAAVLSLLKGLLAKITGNPESASLSGSV